MAPAAIDTRKSTISVVIPTLNEAACIEDTLANVQAQDGPVEVIVVDGGSDDGTRERAQRQARVTRAPRGRATQMNRGAQETSGDVLLFLHADSRLPPEGLSAIRHALADPTVEGGTFRLRFDRDGPLLRLYSLCTRLSWSRLCFGDRGQFLRRSVFEELGGFPEWPLFEDLEMAHRLCKRGGFCFLPQHVTTSARRFDRYGRLRQQLCNAYLWMHYLGGTDPTSLTDFYPYRS